MTFSLHQRGVVMSSQITHTQSSTIQLLPHYFDTCAWIFSSCALFTVYPNGTTRAREGGPKEHRASKYGRMKLNQSHINRALHSFLSFAHCCAVSTVIPLLPKATFTPSSQPNLRLSRTLHPLTSAINVLLAIQYSSILSTCPNHLNTL